MKDRCSTGTSITTASMAAVASPSASSWDDVRPSFQQDMGERPERPLRIDRIDVNGHYTRRELPLGYTQRASAEQAPMASSR